MIDPPRLLRCRSERPCDTRAKKRDELPPPHRLLLGPTRTTYHIAEPMGGLHRRNPSATAVLGQKRHHNAAPVYPQRTDALRVQRHFPKVPIATSRRFIQ